MQGRVGQEPLKTDHKPTCFSKSQWPGTGTGTETGCGGAERGPAEKLIWAQRGQSRGQQRALLLEGGSTVRPPMTHGSPVAGSDGGPEAATSLVRGRPTPRGRKASPRMGQQQARVSPSEGTSSLVQLGNGFPGGWGHGTWHAGCHSPQHPDRKRPGINGEAPNEASASK